VKRSRLGRIGAILLAGAMTLGLAACGGGSDAGGGDGALRTYKIAGYYDYSGAFATRGPGVEAISELWLDWFNQTQGKDLNVQLELEKFDAGYSPAKALEVHRRAIQDPSIIAIAGFGSPVLLGVQEQLPQDKLPLMLCGPSYSFMNKPGWGFAPVGDLGASWATGVKWYSENVWKGQGPIKVAAVSFDGSSGKDFVSSMKQVLGTNADVTLEEYIPPTATSVGVNVDRIVAANADVVVIGTTDALQPLVLDELKKRNFDMTKVMLSQHENLGQMLQLKVPPANLEGVYEFSSINYNDESTDAYKLFAERKDQFGAQWDSQTTQVSGTYFALTGAIAEAAKKKPTGDLTGQDVYDALDAGTFSGHGLLGDITFKPDNRRLGATSGWVMQMQDGKIDTVAGNVSMLPLP
jgi:ABC-type branched-subunit amino acid transport system substrate-binding protein